MGTSSYYDHCPICGKNKMKIIMYSKSGEKWGECLNCGATSEDGIISESEKEITDDLVESIVETIIDKIEEEKTVIDDEEDIYDYFIQSKIFYMKNLYKLLEENKASSLSKIPAHSEVVGSYQTLENLLSDVVNDILIQKIMYRIKDRGYAL